MPPGLEAASSGTEIPADVHPFRTVAAGGEYSVDAAVAKCEEYLTNKEELYGQLWQPAGLAGLLDVNMQFDVVPLGANQPTKVGARAILLGWPMFADGVPTLPGSSSAMSWGRH